MAGGNRANGIKASTTTADRVKKAPLPGCGDGAARAGAADRAARLPGYMSCPVLWIAAMTKPATSRP